MSTPFKHPLARHSALDVLGYRRNGSPIYTIAGGSTPPAVPPTPAPPAVPPPAPVVNPPAPPAPPAPAVPPVPEPIDWKAESRKHEARAKANADAAAELATLKASQMSDQEKALEAARTEGRTSAAADYGQKLAAAEFRAAAATAGVVLGEAAALINTAQFVGADGNVDSAAITAAVGHLKTLAPPTAGRSGGDHSAGGEGPLDLDKQIEEATKARDFNRVVALKRQRAATVPQ